MKWLSLVFALFLAGCAATQKQPAPAVEEQDSALSQVLPVDPQVSSGTLDNGLRYFIRTNHKPENRAELRLAVDVGSVLEEEGEQGLAHFAEHMAFNGTEHFEKQELIDGSTTRLRGVVCGAI